MINPVGTYRVTRYMDFGIARIRQGQRDFRWYWQANVYSWFLHHVLGYSCNTWKRGP